MGKHKKVFAEAISEMKHFLVGAGLVLTLVAVVPALAQQMLPMQPPPGGNTAQQPSIGQPMPIGQPTSQVMPLGQPLGQPIGQPTSQVMPMGQQEMQSQQGLGQQGLSQFPSQGQGMGLGQGQGKGLGQGQGFGSLFPGQGKGVQSGFPDQGKSVMPVDSSTSAMPSSSFNMEDFVKEFDNKISDEDAAKLQKAAEDEATISDLKKIIEDMKMENIKKKDVGKDKEEMLKMFQEMVSKQQGKQPSKSSLGTEDLEADQGSKWGFQPQKQESSKFDKQSQAMPPTPQAFNVNEQKEFLDKDLMKMFGKEKSFKPAFYMPELEITTDLEDHIVVVDASVAKLLEKGKKLSIKTLRKNAIVLYAQLVQLVQDEERDDLVKELADLKFAIKKAKKTPALLKAVSDVWTSVKEKLLENGEAAEEEEEFLLE